MKDVLFLILARSGSKGVPSKNVRLLGELPLLAWRILTAKKTHLSYDLILSTDSEEYAQIGREFGARAPFLRPPQLSNDDSSSVDACLHAINWLETHERGSWRYLCLLEPTSPFTKIEWIEDAIQRIEKNHRSSIVACKESLPHTRFIQDEAPDDSLGPLYKSLQDTASLNRQEFKRQITPSGNFYIVRIDSFKQNQRFYNEDTSSYFVPSPYDLEIDQPLDFLWAEFMLESQTIKKSDLGI